MPGYGNQVRGITIKSPNPWIMQRVIQFAAVIALGLLSTRALAAEPQPSASPAQPTPIPLTKMASEAQSTLTTVQEMNANALRVQASTEAITASLSNLMGEIDPRIAEDTRLLSASPSLDMLYQMKLTWSDFGNNLSTLARELTQNAESLEEELARLDQLNKSWQATLQSARQQDTPPPALQSLQNVVDSIEQARSVAGSGRIQVLTVLSRVSDEQTRVRRTLSSVEQSQIRALKGLFVRDRAPIWSFESGLSRDWGKKTGDSFSSQMRASAAFTKRLPFTFLVHVFVIVVIAAALRWMRRRIQGLAKDNPDLQRAFPILDLPVSTAFVVSVLISPSIYPQAPRLIQAILATVALIPTVVILRRLLDRDSSPVLNALVAMYFVDQIRILVASLPGLARLLFLAQMLGGSLFLLWLLRSQQLRTVSERSVRFPRVTRAIAAIGLVFLPAAFLANILGYVDLGNLLALIFLRSAYAAAVLYTAVRIFEGFIIIALQIKPLRLLRVVSLHRPMIQRRASLVLRFLAVLLWLDIILGFFGLLSPLLTMAKAALNASVSMGALSVSLGAVLAFATAIWASFLVSRFLRFLLEEDVYKYFLFSQGIPYAISTMLHYTILLIGFFIALGALGIDLTKITILAGAFSVGVGIGLQNVINNFVSGLILLFERPIKIGDIIEVAGNVGEVRRIGIRASIIRTADGSDVIIPNGSLISGQVTNWTLSDRRRAVEVSVSVVGGIDPERVAALLKSTAANHPNVAKEPAPQVHVVNWTASAIAFQLRVWTDRHEKWAQLRSELSIAINRALARENIAIA
jgi:potassium-dependent mechanosensitive channel